MSLDLHAGDTFHPDHYDLELEVVAIHDHTADAIGRIVYEAVDQAGYAWFVIEGICIKGGVR